LVGQLAHSAKRSGIMPYENKVCWRLGRQNISIIHSSTWSFYDPILYRIQHVTRNGSRLAIFHAPPAFDLCLW